MNIEKLEILSEYIDTANNSVVIEEVLIKQQLQQKWHRYHLIGDVIRNDAINCQATNFTDKVIRKLEQETTVFSPQKHSKKPLAQWAIAASLISFTIVSAWLFRGTAQVWFNEQNLTKTEIRQDKQLLDINSYLAQHGAVASSNKPLNIQITSFNQ